MDDERTPAQDDDLLDRVFLSRHDGSSFGSDRDPQPGRSTRAVALLGLAVVTVLVAVVLTLVSVLVDTSSAPPTTPALAAERWGLASWAGTIRRAGRWNVPGRRVRTS